MNGGFSFLLSPNDLVGGERRWSAPAISCHFSVYFCLTPLLQLFIVAVIMLYTYAIAYGHEGNCQHCLAFASVDS